VYEACKATPDLKPDLIVGHSGFGTTVFLRELYDCPIISLFEYYYHAHGSDLDFRPDFPPLEMNVLRARTRNAMILLDLEACAAGYTPTRWQWGLLPEVWRPKVEIIHDGIDTSAWRRRPAPRRVGEEAIDAGTRIVTYVSRGLGSDRVLYGNDSARVKTTTFREHVLLTEKPDLTRFRFLGTVPPARLAELLSVSDLHVYLTVPFVLSWSVLNALACECTVLASDTAPVREVIRHEENGLLADFFDTEALAAQALRVLRYPGAYRSLGRAGRAAIEERDSLEQMFPKLWDLFIRTTGRPVIAKES
jgi:glycosyltransferase involved in cell wall biosynthesis